MSYSISKTHRIHGTSISTYIYHKNQTNVKQKSTHLKICVKLEILPNYRGENKKYLKPPPSSFVKARKTVDHLIPIPQDLRNSL